MSDFRLKCTKIVFGWGSAPDPAGGAHSAPPDLQAWLKGAYFKGKGRGYGKGGDGEEREGNTREGKGREGTPNILLHLPVPVF